MPRASSSRWNVDQAWFTRDEVKAALAGPTDRLAVPPAMAIAHHLIRAWAESPEG